MYAARRENGLALIAVLGVLALLTVLALAASEFVRKRGYSARASADQAQNVEYADSAIRLALLEMTDPAPNSSPSIPSRFEFEIFGERVPVEVSWEAGRIDLNAADDVLLYAFFASHGWNEPDARSLAAKIVDWRDPDDDRSVGGAETNEYAVQGRTGPRNAPFESPAEIREVLGLESLSDDLLDGLTVYSHTQDVRAQLAEPVVKETLKWARAQRLANREWFDGSEDNAARPITAAGDAVRLRACLKGKAQLCRVAILRITGSRERPALVYAWYSELATQLPAGGASEVGPATK
jgi:general secretion pathway protein K